MKGWMTQNEWGSEIRKINATEHPVVTIGIDGEGLGRLHLFVVFAKRSRIHIQSCLPSADSILLALAPQSEVSL